jgi:hypothetical protein
VVRAVLLELDAELGNLLLEVQELLLDVSSLLILQGKDGLLDGAKSAL